MPKHNRRYPWPASALDRDAVHELHIASKRTGIPITQLIADAVHTALNEALERTEKSTPIGFTVSQQRPQQTVA